MLKTVHLTQLQPLQTAEVCSVNNKIFRKWKKHFQVLKTKQLSRHLTISMNTITCYYSPTIQSVPNLCFGHWNSPWTHGRGIRFHGNHCRGIPFHSHRTRCSSSPRPRAGNASSSGYRELSWASPGCCRCLPMPCRTQLPLRSWPSDAVSPWNCSRLPLPVHQLERRTGTFWNPGPQTSDRAWRKEAKAKEIISCS